MRELLPRQIVESIMPRLLGDERVVVLTGARQVGKTSIMRLLMDRLSSIGIGKERVFYFDQLSQTPCRSLS